MGRTKLRDIYGKKSDFDRVGADGKPREQHIDKAIAVSQLTLKAGDSLFIPAQDEKFKLIGKCGALLSYV